MNLVDGEIELILTDDREYLARLILGHKLNLLNQRGVERYLKFVRYVWVGWAYGSIPGGVLYFCEIPGIGWTFDAYKEDRRLKNLDNKGNFSYRAAILALNWFEKQRVSENVISVIDEKNRGAKRMLEKLGFKFQSNKNGFLNFAKEFDYGRIC